MEEYDTINLISKLEQSNESNCLTLSWSLTINGKAYHPKLTLDISSLAKSCQLSGEFYIFTCGCGVPECAGIEDGIQVEQQANAIFGDFMSLSTARITLP